MKHDMETKKKKESPIQCDLDEANIWGAIGSLAAFTTIPGGVRFPYAPPLGEDLAISRGLSILNFGFDSRLLHHHDEYTIFIGGPQ
jgi:hypothetical protein